MSLSEQRPPTWLMVPTGMLCTIVLVVFARLAYGLVLPAMREGLGLSYAEAANLGTVTALGYLSLVMVAGAFASRWGGRKAIILGLVSAGLGFVGLSLASNYLVLMVLMVMLGCGTAFGYTPLISLLGSWFPERRGWVIGMANSGVGTGILIAGSLVPYLVQNNPEGGWRMVWAVFAGCALLVFVAVTLFLRDPPQIREGGPGDSPLPLNRSGVYRNPHVLTVGGVYAVVGLTYIVQSIFMYSFALDEGVPAVTAGRLVALSGLLAIGAGPCWGWISDRIGRSNTLVICMSFALCATAMPVVWPTLASFITHFVVIGLCVTGLFTSVLAASTETVHPRQAAMAVSFVTVFFAIGQLIGPAIAGAVIEWTGGFRAAFAISCLAMVVGLFLSWHTRNNQVPRTPPTPCSTRLPDAGAE